MCPHLIVPCHRDNLVLNLILRFFSLSNLDFLDKPISNPNNYIKVRFFSEVSDPLDRSLSLERPVFGGRGLMPNTGKPDTAPIPWPVVKRLPKRCRFCAHVIGFYGETQSRA